MSQSYLGKVWRGIGISRRLSPLFLPQVKLPLRNRLHLGVLQAGDILGLPFSPLGTKCLEKRAEIFLSGENIQRCLSDVQRTLKKSQLMGNFDYYLAKLLVFRGMKDDLPEHKVAPDDPEYARYKCIGGNIIGIRYILRELVENRIVVERERIGQIKSFLKWKPDFTRFTTREEIERINGILDLAISWIRPLTTDDEVQRYFRLINQHLFNQT